MVFPRTAFAEGKDKAGRWMFNFRVGAAATLGRCDWDCGGRFGYRRAQFVISPEIAVALDRDYNAYLGLMPMFQINDNFTVINIPLTFQYDIEIKKVKGLYVYPKVTAGYSHWVEGEGNYFMTGVHGGVKYQFHEHVHAGGEPIGFTFYVGERNGRSDFNAQYHFLGHIGFDW